MNVVIDSRNLRTFPRRLHELLGILCQKSDILPGAVFQDHRHAAGRTNARDRGRRKQESLGLRQLSQSCVDLLENGQELFFRLFSLVPGVERDEEERIVGRAHRAQ